MLEKNQIVTLKINKSEIVEGVYDIERSEKMPPWYHTNRFGLS